MAISSIEQLVYDAEELIYDIITYFDHHKFSPRNIREDENIIDDVDDDEKDLNKTNLKDEHESSLEDSEREEDSKPTEVSQSHQLKEQVDNQALEKPEKQKNLLDYLMEWMAKLYEKVESIIESFETPVEKSEEEIESQSAEQDGALIEKVTDDGDIQHKKEKQLEKALENENNTGINKVKGSVLR